MSGPITFGLIRPVVVFPPSVSVMPAHVQEAIAYHELLHVQRRDFEFQKDRNGGLVITALTR